MFQYVCKVSIAWKNPKLEVKPSLFSSKSNTVPCFITELTGTIFAHNSSLDVSVRMRSNVYFYFLRCNFTNYAGRHYFWTFVQTLEWYSKSKPNKSILSFWLWSTICNIYTQRRWLLSMPYETCLGTGSYRRWISQCRV